MSHPAKDAGRVVAYKQAYARVTGGVVSGLLLSQIAYWAMPVKNGKSKLTVRREGKFWLAKSAKGFQQELALTEYQLRESIKTLRSLKLIETRVFRFNGRPMTHIWLDSQELQEQVSKFEKP